jgi:hypothetical protein
MKGKAPALAAKKKDVKKGKQDEEPKAQKTNYELIIR